MSESASQPSQVSPPAPPPVLHISGLDPDRLMLKGVDLTNPLTGEPDPWFSPAEAGKVFFRRGASWMRWLEGDPKPTGLKWRSVYREGKWFVERTTKLGKVEVKGVHDTMESADAQRDELAYVPPIPNRLIIDGHPIPISRTKDSGARRYDLFTIEVIAHALASATPPIISGEQLARTLLVVQAEARLYGYL